MSSRCWRSLPAPCFTQTCLDLAARKAATRMIEELEPRRLLSVSTIISEGFESAALPGAWGQHVDSANKSSARWGINSARAGSGARSAFASNMGTSVSTRKQYDDDQHIGLTRSNISLAGFKTATLSFKYWMNIETSFDYLSVHVSDSSGRTARVFQDTGDRSDRGFTGKTVDLTAFAGQSGLSIEFRFDSDGSVVNAAPSGVWIDDVTLSADTQPPSGSITGTVYSDDDGNHMRGQGEPGLGGWIVYLDQNQNGTRDASELYRTTTSTGSYDFSGLPVGTYYVAEQVRPGYQQTSPGAGGSTPSDYDITVNFADDNLSITQRSAFETAAARWEQIILGDLPDMLEASRLIDDVLIDAYAPSIDGVGGTLGQAAPTAFRDGTYLPYHGFMEFDAADLSDLESSGQLVPVIMHEMAHVLGFGTIWESVGLLSGGGGNDPGFIGASAVAQFNAIFGRSDDAVPVENSGGPGTRDSHWRESTFGNELMTGYLGGTSNPISRVTVASLEDLGYVVNLGAADLYVPPTAPASSIDVASARQAPGLVLPGAGGTLAGVPQSPRKIDARSAPAVSSAPLATLPMAHTVLVLQGVVRSGIDFGNQRINQAPVVGGIAASAPSGAAGTTFTLTATGVSDPDDSVTRVTFYRERNGIAGLQVGAGGDLELGSDTTGSDGYKRSVSTAGLPAGSYKFYAQATDSRGAVSAGGTSAPVVTHTVVAPSALGSIAGLLYDDRNGDGVRDAATDGPLAGWKVYLDTNANGLPDTSERSTLTGSDGRYVFSNLAAATYSVRSVISSGHVRTSGAVHVVTLPSGAQLTGRDFGAARFGTITGRVFNDADGDGARDYNEHVLSGVRVYVDVNRNNVFDAGESSQITNASGNYAFSRLKPGTYDVRQQQVPGLAVTTPQSGAHSVVVTSGGNMSSRNFANRAAPSAAELVLDDEYAFTRPSLDDLAPALII